MRKFLIASHGRFSSGIRTSLELIIGPVENLYVIDAYAEGNHSAEENIREVMDHLSEADEMIVFTDIMGGSITNQVVSQSKGRKVHVVSGTNLPLLIDIVLAGEEIPAREVIEESIGRAKEQIVYINKLITQETAL